MATASKDSGYVDNWQVGKTVIECNLHMLTTEDCSDVIFHVGSEKQVVRAHRYVLVSRSCVFHAMFCGPLAEKGEVTIPDIDPHIFKEFLRYLYTDAANITPLNVTGLLYTSRKYAVDGLLSLCSAFLEKSLCEENVCQILEQCHGYGEVDLEQKALHILTEAGVKVVKSQGFLDLCEICLGKFLKSEELHLKEEEIFEAVLSWSRDKCKRENENPTPANLRKHLAEMRYEIRFASLPQEYLVNVVGPTGMLTSEERLKIMDRTVNTNIDIIPFKCGMRKNNGNTRNIFKVSRYSTIASSWGVVGKPEAVAFSVNKNIKLIGCQLYGPAYSRESSYRVTIQLHNDCDEMLSQPICDEVKTLSGDNELNDVMFPEPLTIVAGSSYSVCLFMSGNDTEFGKEGQSSVSVNGVNFSFRDSKVGEKRLTSSLKGQIPGLIWRF